MPTLHFKGKTFVQNHHLAVKYHQLVPKKELSLTDKVSLHDNLIIQGDNLKALKALLPTYSGKVKCVCIDPPYNTGNEKWVYNDNVNSPMIMEWLGKEVDTEDLTRHDKWLCMMMPRLKLLRELMSEDGVIFISIDDDEQHRLRMLCDEIFGAMNFVTNIIWNKNYASKNDAKYFSDSHDFILCYAKNKINGETKTGWIRNLLPRTEKQDVLYKFDSNDGNGFWRPDNLTVKTYSADYDYPITNPNTGKEYHPTKGRCWITNKTAMQKWIEENRVFFGKDGTGAPQLKRYANEVKQGIVPMTIWGYDEVGHTDESRKELKEIFSESDSPFTTPKPSRLLKRLIQLSSNKKDFIVLDSFAGSGTTAQAVLDLNKEDGGIRKFILVEQEDYANSITAERVRRVIKGVKTAKNENLKAGLGGTFSYFELGDTIEMESLLRGNNLPTFTEFARYLFYTATGEEFNEKTINEETGFIGESRNYEAYLFYKPDIEWLKKNALTLELCKSLPEFKGKRRLVFAPAKYVDDHSLLDFRIDFSQLPYEIYRIQK
jgi:adenine-specific DNA-methyltransferase